MGCMTQSMLTLRETCNITCKCINLYATSASGHIRGGAWLVSREGVAWESSSSWPGSAEDATPMERKSEYEAKIGDSSNCAVV